MREAIKEVKRLSAAVTSSALLRRRGCAPTRTGHWGTVVAKRATAADHGGRDANDVEGVRAKFGADLVVRQPQVYGVGRWLVVTFQCFKDWVCLSWTK
jgi:hypothetical protein